MTDGSEIDPGAPVSEPQPHTPGEIYSAFALFAFAIASPFIGNFFAEHAEGADGFGRLGVLILWVIGGVIAAIVGLMFTISGARLRPRSLTTQAAMVTAALLVVFILYAIIALSI